MMILLMLMIIIVIIIRMMNMMVVLMMMILIMILLMIMIIIANCEVVLERKWFLFLIINELDRQRLMVSENKFSVNSIIFQKDFRSWVIIRVGRIILVLNIYIHVFMCALVVSECIRCGFVALVVNVALVVVVCLCGGFEY